MKTKLIIAASAVFALSLTGCVVAPPNSAMYAPYVPVPVITQQSVAPLVVGGGFSVNFDAHHRPAPIPVAIHRPVYAPHAFPTHTPAAAQHFIHAEHLQHVD
jgi:hypothetical protein